MKKIVWMILYVMIAYMIIWCSLLLLQRHFIYYPTTTKPQNLAIQSHLIQTQTNDGLTLRGAYFPAQSAHPTIVVFHGNAGHYGYRYDKFKPYLEVGYGVLLASYRGYGGNPGSPSEKGFYRDGQAWLDQLHQQGVDCIILYGESIGTAVASKLAQHFLIQALILEAPFTKLSDIAAWHLPWLIGLRWGLQDQFNNQAHLKSLQGLPKLFILAGQDQIIPNANSVKLYHHTPIPKEKIVIQSAQHNTLSQYDIDQKVQHFLQQVIHIDNGLCQNL